MEEGVDWPSWSVLHARPAEDPSDKKNNNNAMWIHIGFIDIHSILHILVDGEWNFIHPSHD